MQLLAPDYRHADHDVAGDAAGKDQRVENAEQDLVDCQRLIQRLLGELLGLLVVHTVWFTRDELRLFPSLKIP